MALTPDERAHLKRLGMLLASARRAGPRGLDATELRDLPRLYRFASSIHARLETTGEDPRVLGELRPRLLAAHGLLHRDPALPPGERLARLGRFFLVEVPRTVRAEWRFVLVTFLVVYGLALAAWLLVRADLAAAYSLMDVASVDREIEQLRAVAPGEPFRGNFDFGLGASPTTSGAILGNNLRVAVLFFVAALVPPLYALVLGSNGLMLGTYTAVAGHWGQAGSISSILWCHGVLEIQAFVLAGTAGLVLLRAWIAPGPWTRSHAMRLESRRAARLAAATVPMLVAAGLVEGFVSPHAPLGVRVAVAVASGVALGAWLGLGGRGGDPAATRERPVTAGAPPR